MGPVGPTTGCDWGTLQRQLGQNQQALNSFEQASKINPKDTNALLSQGMLLETLGKGSQASAIYNRVLGIDPENPLALNNIAFMNAEQGTNLDQAMTFAERAKKRVPNSPDISDTLGLRLYAEESQFGSAPHSKANRRRAPEQSDLSFPSGYGLVEARRPPGREGRSSEGAAELAAGRSGV